LRLQVQLLLRVDASASARAQPDKRTPLIALAAACADHARGGAKDGGAEGSVAGSSGAVMEGAAEGAGGATDWAERMAELGRRCARAAELLLVEGKAEAGSSDARGRSALCYAREARNLTSHLVRRQAAAPDAALDAASASGAAPAAACWDGLIGVLRGADKRGSPLAVSAPCWRGTACSFCGDLFFG